MARFARHYGRSPEQLDLEDIRQFHLHLLNDLHYSAEAVNQSVSALKFLYITTLEMAWSDEHFPRARRPHKLPIVLSHEEVVRFFDYVPSLRYRAALMTCYGAGLRVSEAVAVKISDIDSQRMLLRVEQGKGRKDRYAMLSPRLLEVLRVWWRAARPEYWLFPSWRSGRHLNTTSLQMASNPSFPVPFEDSPSDRYRAPNHEWPPDKTWAFAKQSLAHFALLPAACPLPSLLELSSPVTMRPEPNPSVSLQLPKTNRARAALHPVTWRPKRNTTMSQSAARQTANAANARLSTGPKTPEGKARSSGNARTHGLTGQTIILPSEDQSAYQRHSQSLLDDCRPKGAIETQIVQSLIDTSWRINRATAVETNLLSLGITEMESRIHANHPEAEAALAMALAFREHNRAFANISVHSQRLTRQFERTLALLRQIQAERRKNEERQLDNAAKIFKMHNDENAPYNPADDGFVFSKAEIETYMGREERRQQANHHDFYADA